MGNSTRLKERVISGMGSSKPACKLAAIDGNAAIQRKNMSMKYFMHCGFRYLFSCTFWAAVFFRLLKKPIKWCTEPKGQTQLQKNRPNTIVNTTVANAHKRGQ